LLTGNNNPRPANASDGIGCRAVFSKNNRSETALIRNRSRKQRPGIETAATDQFLPDKQTAGGQIKGRLKQRITDGDNAADLHRIGAVHTVCFGSEPRPNRDTTAGRSAIEIGAINLDRIAWQPMEDHGQVIDSP